ARAPDFAAGVPGPPTGLRADLRARAAARTRASCHSGPITPRPIDRSIFLRYKNQPMTFLEAALELLRQQRKPLHFKKLAELAIKQNLLDHVGRAPDTAMQTALANAIKKGHPDVLVRVSPGVFGLHHYAPPQHEPGRRSPTAAPAAAPA